MSQVIISGMFIEVLQGFFSEEALKNLGYRVCYVFIFMPSILDVLHHKELVCLLKSAQC